MHLIKLGQCGGGFGNYIDQVAVVVVEEEGSRTIAVADYFGEIVAREDY